MPPSISSVPELPHQHADTHRSHLSRRHSSEKDKDGSRKHEHKHKHHSSSSSKATISPLLNVKPTPSQTKSSLGQNTHLEYDDEPPPPPPDSDEDAPPAADDDSVCSIPLPEGEAPPPPDTEAPSPPKPLGSLPPLPIQQDDSSSSSSESSASTTPRHGHSSNDLSVTNKTPHSSSEALNKKAEERHKYRHSSSGDVGKKSKGDDVRSPRHSKGNSGSQDVTVPQNKPSDKPQEKDDLTPRHKHRTEEVEAPKKIRHSPSSDLLSDQTQPESTTPRHRPHQSLSAPVVHRPRSKTEEEIPISIAQKSNQIFVVVLTH